jgi:alpha-tubulin suppressor-like RCC1 family protein
MAVSLTSRVAWLVSALLIVEACASGDRPTAPRFGPAFAISDAVHANGTAGFYFLPPIVAQPTFSGSFDADITTLNPHVAICDITNGPDSNCGGAGGTSAVIVFTTTSTPAITVDPTTEQYGVNWDTRAAGFDADHTYRVHVTAGAGRALRELGFADVLLTTKPGQAKHGAPGDLMVVKDGRPLPIHFRIEGGIAGSVSVSAATASVATGGTDLLTATVQDLHGAPLVGVTVAWTVTAAPGVVASLAPTSGPTTLLTAGTTPGTAVVTATSAGVSATATVTVLVAGFVVASVDAGQLHSCAVTGAGAGYCWGSNQFGELGDGSGSDARIPVLVAGGFAFGTISSTSNYACGLTTSGRAVCWGHGRLGRLGNGSITDQATPSAVLGDHQFSSVSVGGVHACGLDLTGAAYCWGDNTNGQLGTETSETCLDLGALVPCSTQPVAVGGGLVFTSISAGFFHTCALTATGAAFCWGRNAFGSLGDGTVTPRRTPVAVAGGLSFGMIASGAEYTCALTPAGVPYCWGGNAGGQLGLGPTRPFPIVPTNVVGNLQFKFLSASNENNVFGHTCGITTENAAYCWGATEDGAVGAPTSETCPGFGGDAPHACVTSPVLVTGGVLFKSISAGFRHTCATAVSGEAYCWGGNYKGELGNGTSSFSSTPVRVSPGSPIP